MSKIETSKNTDNMHLEIILLDGEVMDENRLWPAEPHDENAPYVFQLMLRDGAVLMDALEAAAIEYLNTDEGRGKYYGRNDDERAQLEDEDYEPFTMLSLWNDVPEDILEKHGIQLLKDRAAAPLTSLYVDGPIAKFSDAWEDYLSPFEKKYDSE